MKAAMLLIGIIMVTTIVVLSGCVDTKEVTTVTPNGSLTADVAYVNHFEVYGGQYYVGIRGAFQFVEECPFVTVDKNSLTIAPQLNDETYQYTQSTGKTATTVTTSYKLMMVNLAFRDTAGNNHTAVVLMDTDTANSPHVCFGVLDGNVDMLTGKRFVDE